MILIRGESARQGKARHHRLSPGWNGASADWLDGLGSGHVLSGLIGGRQLVNCSSLLCMPGEPQAWVPLVCRNEERFVTLHGLRLAAAATKFRIGHGFRPRNAA